MLKSRAKPIMTRDQILQALLQGYLGRYEVDIRKIDKNHSSRRILVEVNQEHDYVVHSCAHGYHCIYVVLKFSEISFVEISKKKAKRFQKCEKFAGSEKSRSILDKIILENKQGVELPPVP